MEDEQGVIVCSESTLTLRRLLVWMYDPKSRLKTLAALVDFCQGGVCVVLCLVSEMWVNTLCLMEYLSIVHFIWFVSVPPNMLMGI